MTQMRKEKEEELFHQFQTHQQRMCDLLHSQMAQATSDEDQRIAKAIAEQQAKREVSKNLIMIIIVLYLSTAVHTVGRRTCKGVTILRGYTEYQPSHARADDREREKTN